MQASGILEHDQSLSQLLFECDTITDGRVYCLVTKSVFVNFDDGPNWEVVKGTKKLKKSGKIGS